MPKLPGLDRAAVAAGLDALERAPGIADDYVHLRRSLWREQIDAYDRWVDAGSGADREHFLAALLERLCTSVGGPTLERLHAAVGGDLARLGPWLTGARDDHVTPYIDQMARDAVLSTTDILFVGRILLAPLAYASAQSSAAAGPTGRGTCPACGAAPALALIEADGQRRLCCSLCATRWSLARVACVFCGQDRGLETIAVQDDESRWLESCSTCGRFVKTVDVRRRGGVPPVALVEAVAGLTLDLIAESEGLLPAASYVAIV